MKSISQPLLLSRYDYEKSGALICKKSNRRLLGGLTKNGYLNLCLGIDGKKVTFLYHRLVWVFHHGDTSELIDHANRNRLDNRIENLRLCSAFQNQANKAHGRRQRACDLPKGVDLHKKKKYRARIIHNKSYIHLGIYETPEEAGRAYQAASKKLNLEFYCGGQNG